MIDPAAPKHAKRLLTVPEEAKVLQDAVTDVLDRGISLRAVAADRPGCDRRQPGLRPRPVLQGDGPRGKIRQS
jgi:hypothetical protein